MRIVTRFVLAFALLSFGCTDKTINNYNFAQFGGITGRVEAPAAFSQLRIPIMMFDPIYQTETDTDGFFYFYNLEPGVYELIIEPEGLSQRRLTEIVVLSGQVRDMGTIELSTYPYPIYRTYPSDGEVGVRKWNPAITLYADEQLDLDDLNAGTTIEPNLAGEWEESASRQPSSARYNYVLDEDHLEISTTYYVGIASGVRTAKGIPLGTTMEFSFTTEELEVQAQFPISHLPGRVPLSGFYAGISFNTPVNGLVLADALFFTPEIWGLWLSPDNLGEDDYFRFLDTTGANLLPDTEYMLIVSDEVALIGDAHLPEPDTFLFITESYGIVFVSPTNGDVRFYAYGAINVNFNVGMDTISTESAFTLATLDGDPVPGEFIWSLGNQRFLFRPMEELTSGAVYWITLTTDARTAAGETLPAGWVSYFRVR